jgi:NhaP-type Na+/H+ or K+/H+ antiporter
VASLVVVSVLLTTMAVAVVARMLVPAMPWAAAVALGAVVAPPDATAAIAVLRRSGSRIASSPSWKARACSTTRPRS